MPKRIFIISALLLVIVGTGIMSMETGSKSSPGFSEQERQLNQAIQNLQHPKKIARRRAAHQISGLITTPGIQRAIEPLADVLLNRGLRSGIFTQEIVALNLGQIAAHLGSPQGDRAVEALIESLDTEGFDSVRGSVAYALGFTRSELAITALAFSRENDPSPLVKFACDESLRRLARSGIKLTEEIPAGAISQTQSDIDKSVLLDYLKDHIIYSNPPLELEEE